MCPLLLSFWTQHCLLELAEEKWFDFMTPPDGTVRENFISNKLNTITELEKKSVYICYLCKGI